MGVVDLSARIRRQPVDSGTVTEILNAFRIELPAGISLAYQVWEIDPTPLTPKLREQIRGTLWRSRLKRPVSGMWVDDQFAYAVACSEVDGPVIYTGEGEKRYVISPTDVVRCIDLHGDLNEYEADFASAMLQSAFALHLREDQRLFRGHWSDRFYLAAAENAHGDERHVRGFGQRDNRTQARRLVDIFRGFNFRVVHLAGVGFCLVLDVQTSYVGAQTLKEYRRDGAMPNSQPTKSGLTRWIYDYGRVKQSLYLLHIDDRRTIGQTILTDGNSVYKALCLKGPYVRNRVSPHAVGATVIYRPDDRADETRHYTASVALLKPIFTTEAHEVRQLGDRPAFAPNDV